MRLFIATRIDAVVAAQVRQGLQSARKRTSRASWVSADAYHLTYAFLGEQDERVATRLTGALPLAVSGLGRYDGALVGGGFFPGDRRPRVGWLALEDPSPLRLVADAVRQVLEEEGICYDEKPFNPHLTVVRIRERWTAGDVAAFKQACDEMGRIEVKLSRVSLFHSRLLSTGARHDELVAAGLS
jgi:2'-5' RNA ligase